MAHAAAHWWLSPCGLTFLLLSWFPISAGFQGAAGAGGALAVHPQGGRVLCSSSQV